MEIFALQNVLSEEIHLAKQDVNVKFISSQQTSTFVRTRKLNGKFTIGEIHNLEEVSLRST